VAKLLVFAEGASGKKAGQDAGRGGIRGMKRLDFRKCPGKVFQDFLMVAIGYTRGAMAGSAEIGEKVLGEPRARAVASNPAGNGGEKRHLEDTAKGGGGRLKRRSALNSSSIRMGNVAVPVESFL